MKQPSANRPRIIHVRADRCGQNLPVIHLKRSFDLRAGTLVHEAGHVSIFGVDADRDMHALNAPLAARGVMDALAWVQDAQEPAAPVQTAGA